MSRYKCPGCQTEWSTENMAPVCGSCWSKRGDRIAALERELAEAKRILGLLNEKGLSVYPEQAIADLKRYAADAFLDGLNIYAWKEKAEADAARLQQRIDRTLTAVLRYESRHDLDPERGKLWGDLKMALMIDEPQPRDREEK